ncbi:NfeD family protein [Nioella halotolerans]|uniref:NfeD family protein n=1 Tax=Nioella halotolerans TaxID=2303578 RepID=UPI0026A0E865
MDLWAEWWVWGAAAIVLAIGEVILPSFVLLGFGIGAGAMAALLLFGGGVADFVAGSIPVTILSYAIVSLVAWLLLRRFLGVYRGQVRTFDHDINDD